MAVPLIATALSVAKPVAEALEAINKLIERITKEKLTEEDSEYYRVS